MRTIKNKYTLVVKQIPNHPKYYKTKSQALKYAKEYMKIH